MYKVGFQGIYIYIYLGFQGHKRVLRVYIVGFQGVYSRFLGYKVGFKSVKVSRVRP